MSDKKNKPQVRWALKCNNHIFIDRLHSTIQFLINHESKHYTEKFEEFSKQTGIPIPLIQCAWWENQKKHDWKAPVQGRTSFSTDTLWLNGDLALCQDHYLWLDETEDDYCKECGKSK